MNNQMPHRAAALAALSSEETALNQARYAAERAECEARFNLADARKAHRAAKLAMERAHAAFAATPGGKAFWDAIRRDVEADAAAHRAAKATLPAVAA